MAKNCIVCGKNIGFMDITEKCMDGHICKECYHKMGFEVFSYSHSKCTFEQLKEEGTKEKARVETIKQLNITDDICKAAKFDDISRQMIVSDDRGIFMWQNPQKDFAYKYALISYDQIAGFELIEDGKTIVNSVGRAVVGGVLFGGAGAVVGALSAEQKQICNELKIKLTLKDCKESVAFITLISGKEYKNGAVYKQRAEMAQKILAKLQQVSTSSAKKENTPLPTSANDPFIEIRKFKALLDEGIITQEEFNQKKKELLGF